MKSNRIITIILIIAFLIGLCLLLYPKVSNYWNSIHQTREVNKYVEEVSRLDTEAYDRLLENAREYNVLLNERSNSYRLSDELSSEYRSQLDISGTGVMGYIEIPVIGVSLPIYHGTSHAVLQKAVGHLDWTSLPVGGGDTHCVLSGHRGLPSSKLFTDLDKMREGDVFVLKVLNETLTYQVDRILIVEPDDASFLVPESGKDLCTLVTCTPYGVNTHRMLVRGHRIENEEAIKIAHITADAVQIEPMMVAPVLFIIMLILVLAVNAIIPRHRQGGNN